MNLLRAVYIIIGSPKIQSPIIFHSFNWVTNFRYFMQSWYRCRTCGCCWNGTFRGSIYTGNRGNETGIIGGWCADCSERN